MIDAATTRRRLRALVAERVMLNTPRRERPAREGGIMPMKCQFWLRTLIIVAMSGVSFAVAGAAAARDLSCTIGASSKWGSSWCDLSPPQNFPASTKLHISLSPGGAKRVLVRLLPQDQSPDDPVGIIGDPVPVPPNNEISIIVTSPAERIKQISVHGGRNPFNIELGKDNGNAHIVKIWTD